MFLAALDEAGDLGGRRVPEDIVLEWKLCGRRVARDGDDIKDVVGAIAEIPGLVVEEEDEEGLLGETSCQLQRRGTRCSTAGSLTWNRQSCAQSDGAATGPLMTRPG